MAKIKLGTLVEEIRGTIGGITYRKIGAQTLASTRSAGPVNPGKRSTEHFTYLKIAAQAWINLDAERRFEWEQYFAYEKIVPPWSDNQITSPRTLFMFYQYWRQQVGQPIYTDRLRAPLFARDMTITATMYKTGTTRGSIESDGTVVYPQYAAFFGSLVRIGATGPSKWVRKLFPWTGDTPQGYVGFTDWRIWEKFGYPRGLDGLVEQPQPGTVELWVRGVGLSTTNYLNFSPWTKATNLTTFEYPPYIP